MRVIRWCVVVVLFLLQVVAFFAFYKNITSIPQEENQTQLPLPLQLSFQQQDENEIEMNEINDRIDMKESSSRSSSSSSSSGNIRRCITGVITAEWIEERSVGARALCDKLTGQGFPCVVWPAYDGRNMTASDLMSLARSGEDIAPGPKTGWRGRKGFNSVRNVANVLSHIHLARHFFQKEEEEGRKFDCFMMFEDDASVGDNFAMEFHDLLNTVEEREKKRRGREGTGSSSSERGWDVLNLHGAHYLVANWFACLFVDIVESKWVFGAYTRSLSLVFSRTGLETFLGLLPIDTHIDLFMDKSVAAGALRGLRTCNDYVGSAPVGYSTSTIQGMGGSTHAADISRQEWIEARNLYEELHMRYDYDAA